MKSKEGDRRGRRREKLSSREETTPRTKQKSVNERKHRKLPESCTPPQHPAEDTVLQPEPWHGLAGVKARGKPGKN